MIETLIPFLFVGFLASIIFVPIVIIFAKRYGFVDDPKAHKHPAIIHTKPIPRAGGLPIYVAICIGALYMIPELSFTFYMILVGGFIVVLVGLLDDKYDLSPYVRFVLNIISVAIAVFAGVSIPFITNPLSLGTILHFDNLFLVQHSFFIPEILAVFWTVWVMNMLNWSKGVDGQMPGIAAIAAIVIGIASLRFDHITITSLMTAKMSFLVAGASIGFLVFNFYPAKIFPGYSGTILGYMIGMLSIISGVKLATAILVLGVPMIDAIITIVRRISAGKSPFWHDRKHLHHLLLRMGFNQPTIAILYWIFSLTLGVLSLSLSSKGKLFAIVTITIFVSAIIIYLQNFVKKEKE